MIFLPWINKVIVAVVVGVARRTPSSEILRNGGSRFGLCIAYYCCLNLTRNVTI